MSDTPRFIEWENTAKERIVRDFGYRGVSAVAFVESLGGDFIITAQNPGQLAEIWKRLQMSIPLDQAKTVETITVEAVDRNPAVVRVG